MTTGGNTFMNAEMFSLMDVDRVEGVLLGLACGDALGRPVEFNSAVAFEDEGTLTEMIDNWPWGQ